LVVGAGKLVPVRGWSDQVARILSQYWRSHHVAKPSLDLTILGCGASLPMRGRRVDGHPGASVARS